MRVRFSARSVRAAARREHTVPDQHPCRAEVSQLQQAVGRKLKGGCCQVAADGAVRYRDGPYQRALFGGDVQGACDGERCDRHTCVGGRARYGDTKRSAHCGVGQADGVRAEYCQRPSEGAASDENGGAVERRRGRADTNDRAHDDKRGESSERHDEGVLNCGNTDLTTRIQASRKRKGGRKQLSEEEQSWKILGELQDRRTG